RVLFRSKVQVGEAAFFSFLNPVPDEQVVRPVREIVGEGRIELVIQRVLPLQKKIASHDLVFVNGEQQEPVLWLHKTAPDILQETVGLRQQTILVFAHFQVHLEEGAQFLL